MINKIDRLNESMTIGEIAKDLPESMNLFYDEGIDFCCGGDRTIKQAAKEDGFDLTVLVEKLGQVSRMTGNQKSTIPFNEMTKEELISHIVDTHHQYVLENLPRIESLTETIKEVHGENHGDSLKPLYENFVELKNELMEHLRKEEEELFPLVIKMEKGKASKKEIERLITELENEHENAGEILKENRRITKDFTPPAGACNTYVFTFEKLIEFERDLFQHIHLENNLLFKDIENTIS